ncbi:MAG TPA: hypothetical protein VEJ63_09760 [Planctomycetota bacterium]|nr:hypothetical protein [Planctomycetota bacterium]
MKLKVLTPSEAEQFVELGYVLVRNVFPESAAAEVRQVIWKKIGLPEDDPAGWTKPVVHLQEGIKGGPVEKCFTPRLWDAFDDVMGEGRYNKGMWLGWWPVAFPGFDKPPWTEPQKGWHVDGQQFHHHVDSADQGLLPIFIFSQIDPGDGGTCLEERSHFKTARVLRDSEPGGLDVHELAKRVNALPRGKVIETNGKPGDVLLMHPFMAHARSNNTGKRVRFICNPCFSLKEKMNLNRANPDEYSLVERAIVKALAPA